MAQETVRLARYAAALRYEGLPAEIVVRAKECIADTVAAIVCGAALPWSRIVTAYAERTGPGGNSRILGTGGPAVTAPAAALANGALAHAFELDSLTRPGAGVHPGATLLPPALALAQQQGLGGRALIAAFVAGCEVMVRIGRATGHTNEQRGFHAPGNTGPFGGAVAGGHLLGLDAERMTMALGIAGSLASGLLEFARAGRGGMVKRLHLGRASEGGVLAASLAADGFTAPDTVLEGPFGFLAVFCREWDVAKLTERLGEHWETTSIALKRYPCHINAHAAVKALSRLQAEHGFTGAEVEAVAITGSERMASLHNIPEPADLMMAQYSVPFCAALALYRDPRNPEILFRRRARRSGDSWVVPPGDGAVGGRGRRARHAGHRSCGRSQRRRAAVRGRDGRHPRRRRSRRQIRPADPRGARRAQIRSTVRTAAASRRRGQPRLARSGLAGAITSLGGLGRCFALSAPLSWRSALRRAGLMTGRR